MTLRTELASRCLCTKPRSGRSASSAHRQWPVAASTTGCRGLGIQVFVCGDLRPVLQGQCLFNGGDVCGDLMPVFQRQWLFNGDDVCGDLMPVFRRQWLFNGDDVCGDLRPVFQRQWLFNGDDVCGDLRPVFQRQWLFNGDDVSGPGGRAGRQVVRGLGQP